MNLLLLNWVFHRRLGSCPVVLQNVCSWKVLSKTSCWLYYLYLWRSATFTGRVCGWWQDSGAMAVRVSRMEGTTRLGVAGWWEVVTARVSVLGLTGSSRSIMVKFKGWRTQQDSPYWARQSNSWKVNNHLLLLIEKLNSLLLVYMSFLGSSWNEQWTYLKLLSSCQGFPGIVKSFYCWQLTDWLM